MTTIVGRSDRATYSYQLTRSGAGPRGGSAALIRATRATPTTGFSAGRAATRGDLVKPELRYSGRSTSSALQTLAVSNCASASTAARVNVASDIFQPFRNISDRPGD